MLGPDRGGRGGYRLSSAALFVLLFLVGALAGSLFFALTRRAASPAGPAAVSGEARDASGETIRPVRYDGGAEAGHRAEGSDGAGTAERESAGDATARIAAADLDQNRRNAITMAAENAGRAVVTVGVIKTRLVRGAPRVADPFDLFFHRYLPGVVYEQKIPGIGSGIIVDPEGIVLTNEHVVRDATEIQIILADGRTLNAELIGADPNLDLAVLRVRAENLPSAELGDSDDLVVGEWAIAIGNPFGFYLNDHQPTVTVGVISALHRDVKGDETAQAIYKDMIQTDAAINPGNSGGALVNALGQVIGINTFIFTQGGGSLGIGFAMPINAAVRTAREIIQYGHTRPVWIGIYAQPISPWAARRLGRESTEGLLASRVEAGSPAERAGMREMDIILEINGRPVSTPQQAMRTIFGAQIGDRIAFTVERQGRRLTIPVRIEAAPETGG